MLPNKGLHAYRSTEVTSRTPLELVVMLYDGAIRFVGAAREAIGRGDIRARSQAISRALAIVSELQNTLDIERGGEMAESLDDLYRYLTQRLVQATVSNDVSALDEARRLLETLRDGWHTIAAQAASAAPIGARR
ncbi:MAG: flagellar export chaperone FliS [Vicinamibacterales bacterium]